MRVTPLASAIQQLAMIGHELQHAVKVAATPEIVDVDSMFREYRRIGYANGATGSGASFDTQAALEVGVLVSGLLCMAPSSR